MISKKSKIKLDYQIPVNPTWIARRWRFRSRKATLDQIGQKFYCGRGIPIQICKTYIHTYNKEIIQTFFKIVIVMGGLWPSSLAAPVDTKKRVSGSRETLPTTIIKT